MHSLRTRFSIGVVWAMIPLTLVSALPRMGCICADGRYKVVCDRIRSDACRPVETAAAEAGTCSCCHRHGQAADDSKGCKTSDERKQQSGKAAASHSCCQRAAERAPDCSGSAPGMQSTDADRCCTPVLSAPLLPPVVSAAVLSLDCASPVFITPYDLPSLPHVCAGMVAEREHVLPPIDRVVINQVFLI